MRSRYGGRMTDPHPDTGANGVQALDPQQLGAYFALMEGVSLLQHQVEQHLRTEGDLSYVQFQLLARLADAHGHLTMTQLADGVVYSRSGLTYQAGLLEKAGLITRGPSSDDERATLVTITDNGRALFDRVLPGHIQVIRRLQTPPQPHLPAPGRDAGLNRNTSLSPAPRLVGRGRHGPGDHRTARPAPPDAAGRDRLSATVTMRVMTDWASNGGPADSDLGRHCPNTPS